MSTEHTYEGGAYLFSGGHRIPGGHLPGDGENPIFLSRVRTNVVNYDPQKVLMPDNITDACGRMATFCIEACPVLGYEEPVSARIADLGTGSGVFLTSMINGLKIPTDKSLEVHAIDNDPDAISVAADNIARAFAQSPRPVEVVCEQSDYGSAPRGVYDVMYFNPPYLKRGHDISHDEARLAPENAVYSDDPVQEYERVVPLLRELLSESGIALVRLPRESTQIDEWAADYLRRHDETAYLLLVRAGEEGRQGRMLAIIRERFPGSFSDYDYWENYLGGQERRRRAKSDYRPVYHDGGCEFVRVRKVESLRLLGDSALAAK